MKKLFKKWAALVMAAIVCLTSFTAFTACSDDDDETQTYNVVMTFGVTTGVDESTTAAFTANILGAVAEAFGYNTAQRQFEMNGSATTCDLKVISTCALAEILFANYSAPCNATLTIVNMGTNKVVYTKQFTKE